MPDQTYTISELAAHFDVTPRAIRYYEDRGLLSPTRAGQNRIYSGRDRGRLYLILRGKRVGFSLAEIREMLNLYDLNDGQIGQAQLVLEKIRARVSTLETQKQDLEQIISELRLDSLKIEEFLTGNNSGVALELPSVPDMVIAPESDDDFHRYSAVGAE